MQSASYKLKNSADTLKAQAGEAALSGKTFDVAKSLAQTVPIVGSAWTLGEKAVGVADTTGRLGREQATAHFEDRTSNLTDAFWNENNAGNDQHFHQALD